MAENAHWLYPLLVLVELFTLPALLLEERYLPYGYFLWFAVHMVALYKLATWWGPSDRRFTELCRRDPLQVLARLPERSFVRSSTETRLDRLGLLLLAGDFDAAAAEVDRPGGPKWLRPYLRFMLLRHQGAQEQAARELEQAAALAPRLWPEYFDHIAAYLPAQAGTAYARVMAETRGAGWSHYYHAVLRLLVGDAQLCRDSRVYQVLEYPRTEGWCRRWQARVKLAQGQREEARALLESLDTRCVDKLCLWQLEIAALDSSKGSADDLRTGIKEALETPIPERGNGSRVLRAGLWVLAGWLALKCFWIPYEYVPRLVQDELDPTLIRRIEMEFVLTESRRVGKVYVQEEVPQKVKPRGSLTGAPKAHFFKLVLFGGAQIEWPIAAPEYFRLLLYKDTGQPIRASLHLGEYVPDSYSFVIDKGGPSYDVSRCLVSPELTAILKSAVPEFSHPGNIPGRPLPTKALDGRWRYPPRPKATP